MHPKRGRRTGHRDAPSQTPDTFPLHPALISSPFLLCVALWGSADVSTGVPIQLLSFSPTKEELCIGSSLSLLLIWPVELSAGDFLNHVPVAWLVKLMGASNWPRGRPVSE